MDTLKLEAILNKYSQDPYTKKPNTDLTSLRLRLTQPIQSSYRYPVDPALDSKIVVRNKQEPSFKKKNKSAKPEQYIGKINKTQDNTLQMAAAKKKSHTIIYSNHVKKPQKQISTARQTQPESKTVLEQVNHKKKSPPKKDNGGGKTFRANKTKRSASNTPDKSARKKTAPTINIAKQFDRIDKKYEQHKRKMNILSAGSVAMGSTQTNADLAPRKSLGRKRLVTIQDNYNHTSREPKCKTHRSLTANSKTARSNTMKSTDRPNKPAKSRKKHTSKHKENGKGLINSGTSGSLTYRFSEKPRKFITQIKTQHSDEKKSFFDQQYIRRKLINYNTREFQLSVERSGIQLESDRPQLSRASSYSQRESYVDLMRQRQIYDQAAATIQQAWRQYVIKKQRTVRDRNISDLDYSRTAGNTLKGLSVNVLDKYEVAQVDEQDRLNNSSLLNKSIDTFNSEKSSFYESQLEKIRREEQEKWAQMIQVLNDMKNTGDKNLLDQLIKQSEQNRETIRSIEIIKKRKAEELEFEEKKQKYDDAPLPVKQKERRKKSADSINQSFSREHSQKKLLDEVQFFEANIKHKLERSNKNLHTEEQKLNNSSKDPNNNLVELEQNGGSSFKKINISEYLSEASRFKPAIIIGQRENEVPDFNKRLEFSDEKPSLPTDKSDDLHINEIIKLIPDSAIQQPQLKQEAKDKDNQLAYSILNAIIEEAATQLAEDPRMLRNMLVYGNSNSISVFQVDSSNNFDNPFQEPEAPPPVVPYQQPILSTNQFIMELAMTFLKHIHNTYPDELNSALAIPFGETPINLLRILREDTGPRPEHNQQEESALVENPAENTGEDQSSRYRVIIEVNKFVEYEDVIRTQLKAASTVAQYFFNHCVFDSLNEQLDRCRPFGLRGLPPLCLQKDLPIMPFEDCLENVKKWLQEILNLQVGRTAYPDYEMEEIAKLVEIGFKNLDTNILAQTAHDWKENLDLQFQVNYDISLMAVETILMEEIVEMSMLFQRRY